MSPKVDNNIFTNSFTGIHLTKHKLLLITFTNNSLNENDSENCNVGGKHEASRSADGCWLVEGTLPVHRAPLQTYTLPAPFWSGLGKPDAPSPHAPHPNLLLDV